MVNLVVIYDKNDNVLGDFFCKCRSLVLDILLNNKIDISVVDECCIDASQLADCLSRVNQNNFVFCGFLHGNLDSMLINGGDRLISTEINHYLLTNAFIYTFSCHCGAQLADALIKNNAHTFWGYNAEAYVCNDYIDIFAKCSLAGYKYFIEGNAISRSEELMVADINLALDELYLKNALVAACLMDNRNAMVVKGDKNLTIQDFQVAKL